MMLLGRWPTCCPHSPCEPRCHCKPVRRARVNTHAHTPEHVRSPCDFWIVSHFLLSEVCPPFPPLPPCSPLIPISPTHLLYLGPSLHAFPCSCRLLFCSSLVFHCCFSPSVSEGVSFFSLFKIHLLFFVALHKQEGHPHTGLPASEGQRQVVISLLLL